MDSSVRQIALLDRSKFHLLQHRACAQAIRISERLPYLEVVLTSITESVTGFPAALTGRGEITTLALELRRRGGAVDHCDRSHEPVEIALGAEPPSISSVNFT